MPSEGIQTLIVKKIDCVIRDLAAREDIVIFVVEQYLGFARALADRYVVMERGEVILVGETRDMVESDVRCYLTV